VIQNGTKRSPPAIDKNGPFELSEKNLRKLLDVIESLPEEYRHTRCEDIGMSGKRSTIPAEDVSWQTLPVLTLLKESHE